MRIRDPGLLRLLHYELDECAICGTTHVLHLHHVLFRSHGGDDVRANITALCQQHHDEYHHGNGNVRQQLGDLIAGRPETMVYLQQKLGVEGASVWLERHQR